MLTYSYISTIFDYDEKTGDLVRKVDMGSRAKAGSVVRRKDRCGYVFTTVNGVAYQAHRIIWMLVNGRFPECHIDHIDGNTSNNKISNLREANRSQNMQNRRKAHSNSKSGILGVSRKQNSGKWTATIKLNSKSKHLGTFKTPEEARAAYLEAKRTLHSFCTI